MEGEPQTSRKNVELVVHSVTFAMVFLPGGNWDLVPLLLGVPNGSRETDQSNRDPVSKDHSVIRGRPASSGAWVYDPVGNLIAQLVLGHSFSFLPELLHHPVDLQTDFQRNMLLVAISFFLGEELSSRRLAGLAFGRAPGSPFMAPDGHFFGNRLGLPFGSHGKKHRGEEQPHRIAEDL